MTLTIVSVVSLCLSCFAAGFSCATLFHIWMRGRNVDQAAHFTIEGDLPVRDGIFKE